MPKEFTDCVDRLRAQGKSKDSAYAICTDAYKKRHGGRTPQEDEAKQTYTIDITVDSLAGIEHVDIVPIDQSKGIYAVKPHGEERIVQYRFCLLNEARWTEDTAAGWIKKNETEEVKCSLDIDIFSEVIQQDYSDKDKLWAMMPEGFKSAVAKFDPDPQKGLQVIRIKYGVGSKNQRFGRKFFEKAGAKFQGKHFLYNHSDYGKYGTGDFGNARPIGTIPLFLGAKEDGADYACYISPSEGTLRQKIAESIALGNYGYADRVSIEGLGRKSDYTLDGAIKDFHDISDANAIVLTMREGMPGSKIIA